MKDLIVLVTTTNEKMKKFRSMLLTYFSNSDTKKLSNNEYIVRVYAYTLAKSINFNYSRGS